MTQTAVSNAPARTRSARTEGAPITLVSVCKPWRGDDAKHQGAALRSWTRLGLPVVLCGNDTGVAEACARFGFIHEPNVRTGDDLGLAGKSPLLSDVIAAAAAHATGPLCYINADIIVCDDFARRLADLFTEFGRDAFITGRRHNFDFTRFDPIAALDPRTLLPGCRLHPATGTDFFCFRADLFPGDIPDFVIGRTSWDNWLMWMACEHAHPAIDATETVVTFHPDHDYAALMVEAGKPGQPRPRTHWPDSPSILHNRRLVGDRIGDLSDPRWLRLTPSSTI